ncbi:hypothetical protein ACFLZB_02990 [Nanoarchaeota archaeon]
MTYVLIGETILFGVLALSQGPKMVDGCIDYFNYHFGSKPAAAGRVLNEEKKESLLEEKLKTFSGFEHVDQYDSLIVKYTRQWNNEFSEEGKRFENYQPLDPNLVKAMVCAESGSPADREGAFRYDPMQIANKGDPAFPALFNGSESGLEAYGQTDPVFGKKKQTPRGKGFWNYGALSEEERMDKDTSIRIGIRWAFHKVWSFDSNGERSGFKGWDAALLGYNSRASYVKKVRGIFNRGK